MARRIASLVCATAIGGAAFAFTTVAPAQAQPACPDFHLIGAAGSGERDGALLTKDAGMGRVVHKSLDDLTALLAQDGRTITAEAVNYPAKAVPLDGDILGWAGFMSSVEPGLPRWLRSTPRIAQCPNTKVVLAVTRRARWWCTAICRRSLTVPMSPRRC